MGRDVAHSLARKRIFLAQPLIGRERHGIPHLRTEPMPVVNGRRDDRARALPDRPPLLAVVVHGDDSASASNGLRAGRFRAGGQIAFRPKP